MQQVSKGRAGVPVPAHIPETFLVVPTNRRRKVGETEPVISISVMASSGVRLLLSSGLQHQIGWTVTGAKVWVQVFTSATTLKLVFCERTTDNARQIAGDGYVTCTELADWFHLEPGMNFRCKTEVVKNGKLEIWATYPPELRDRIQAVNEARR